MGRRLGGKAEAMAAAAVVELEVEMLEFQRRRAAQFVLPGDAGIAHHDALLHQQPVGKAGLLVRLGRDFESGSEQAALSIATQHQARRLEFEPGQAQLEMPQRAPGQLGLDLVESQGGASLGIADLEAAELQRGGQAGPVRLDAAYADRTVDGRTDQLLDIAAIVFDLRQDRVAQGQQQQGKGKVAKRQSPQQHAQQGAQPWVGWWQLAQTGKQLGNDGLVGS
jgi:hypothetical protein